MIASISSPRLPVAVLPRSDGSLRGPHSTAETRDSFARAEESSHSAQSTDFGQVLQGEVLSRRRPVEYQSTQGFLNERALNKARLVQDSGGPLGAPSVVVKRYLQHFQSTAFSETNQGRSLDVRV